MEKGKGKCKCKCKGNIPLESSPFWRRSFSNSNCRSRSFSCRSFSCRSRSSCQASLISSRDASGSSCLYFARNSSFESIGDGTAARTHIENVTRHRHRHGLRGASGGNQPGQALRSHRADRAAVKTQSAAKHNVAGTNREQGQSTLSQTPEIAHTHARHATQARAHRDTHDTHAQRTETHETREHSCRHRHGHEHRHTNTQTHRHTEKQRHRHAGHTRHTNTQTRRSRPQHKHTNTPLLVTPTCTVWALLPSPPARSVCGQCEC